MFITMELITTAYKHYSYTNPHIYGGMKQAAIGGKMYSPMVIMRTQSANSFSMASILQVLVAFARRTSIKGNALQVLAALSQRYISTC